MIKRLIICFLLIPSLCGAATYTVCASGCDKTNSADVFTAYDLSAGGHTVQYQAAAPGGTASFYETITPPAADAGVLGSPNILKCRTGDTCIIDGQDTRTSGIVLTSTSYWTIDGFTLSNHTSAAIYGKPTSAKTGWTVQNCIINISLTNGVGALANQGIGFNGDSSANFYVSNVVIDNCTIQTGDGSLNEQTDGITLYFVDTVTVKNCNINLRNASQDDPYQHIDGIQTGSTKNPTIFNNTITVYRNHKAGAQGIFLEGSNADGIDLGTFLVYNNILYADGWGSYGIIMSEKGDTSVQKAYNNTVVETYASSTASPFYFDGDNVWFKNNISKTAGSYPGTGLYLTSATQTAAQITNNLYITGTALQDLTRISNTYYTWAEWQAAGYDTGGLNANPALNADYKLSPTSPAKYAGTATGQLSSTDYGGYSWHNPPSIGAYEFRGGVTLGTGAGHQLGVGAAHQLF